MNINVSEDAVYALRRLSAVVLEYSNVLEQETRCLHSAFGDLKDGLGPHSKKLAALLENLDQLAAEASLYNRKLARKAQRAAAIRQQMTDDSPYRLETVSPGGRNGDKSSYVKTTYDGTVSFTDPKTGQRLEKVSVRDVYENSKIDPTMVIPAGTKYPNGQTVREDTTNLDLMRAGKAPFVTVTHADGSKSLVLVELHHLSGEETRQGSAYFTGSERDGSLVEIASTTHDAYSSQLHMGNPSFRRDAHGNKTEDAAKYEAFRSAYWMHRAQKYLQR